MKDFYRILAIFITWRFALFIFASVAAFLLPEFGARFPYYNEQLIASNLPEYIWGFGNFDGVHYLRIAEMGYSSQYSQAFFPLYPILIKLFSYFLPFNMQANLLISGLLLSNIFTVLVLFFLYKLFKLDFDERISYKSILILIAFPTSFYLGAVYTESLFLLLAVLSFLLMRKKRFFLGAAVIGLATATRIFGVLLVPLLIFYLYKSKLPLYKSLFFGLLSFSGILFYMTYLGVNFGDPIYFLNAQPAFGAERTNQHLVFLPQVLYRYVKIFMTVDIKTVLFLNAFLEFIFTIFPLILVFFSRKIIKKEYLFFSLTSLIIPTLTGTLSSMPRYSLMIFPTFPFLAKNLKMFFYPFCMILFMLQIILMVMFLRGYWVS